MEEKAKPNLKGLFAHDHLHEAWIENAFITTWELAHKLEGHLVCRYNLPHLLRRHEASKHLINRGSSFIGATLPLFSLETSESVSLIDSWLLPLGLAYIMSPLSSSPFSCSLESSTRLTLSRLFQGTCRCLLTNLTCTSLKLLDKLMSSGSPFWPNEEFTELSEDIKPPNKKRDQIKRDPL